MKYIEISISFVVASLIIVHGLYVISHRPILRVGFLMNGNKMKQMLQLQKANRIKIDSYFLGSNGQTCVCITGGVASFQKLKFDALTSLYSTNTTATNIQLRLNCKLGHCRDCQIEKSSSQDTNNYSNKNANEKPGSVKVADISCKEFTSSRKNDFLKLLKRGSSIQEYTYENIPKQHEDYNSGTKQEDKHKINVKEVYKRSCIVVIPVKWCNNQEVTTRSKNLDGKHTQDNLMNSGVDEVNFTKLSIPEEKQILVNFAIIDQIKDENSKTNFTNAEDIKYAQQLNLANPFMFGVYDKKINTNATKHTAVDSIASLIRKGKRSKREMHDMMERYQEQETTKKVSKRKGNGKQKDSGSSSNDSKRKMSSTSTPLTLNVSFTGYTDRKFMKTTVKPRVQNPLKMTKEDMEHVHGKEEKQKKDCDDSDESESESKEEKNQNYKNRKDKQKSKSQSKSGGWKSDWD